MPVKKSAGPVHDSLPDTESRALSADLDLDTGRYQPDPVVDVALFHDLGAALDPRAASLAVERERRMDPGFDAAGGQPAPAVGVGLNRFCRAWRGRCRAVLVCKRDGVNDLRRAGLAGVIVEPGAPVKAHR